MVLLPSRDLSPSCRTYMNIIKYVNTAEYCFYNNLNRFEVSHKSWLSETGLSSIFVCSGLRHLMNDVYLCVSSETHKYGLNVKSWTSLWFSEYFYTVKIVCLLLKASFSVCVWESEWEMETQVVIYVLNFNSLQWWTEKKAWWGELNDLCNPECKKDRFRVRKMVI